VANVEAGTECVVCGRVLPAQCGQGRRRRYCDTTCRSTARRRRAPAPPTTCDLRFGPIACGQRADGEFSTAAPLRVRVCARHREAAETLLSGRYADVRWTRYAVPGPPSLDLVEPADQTPECWLRFTDADGWELLAADEVIAGHDGMDAVDVEAAQEWAASQLFITRGVRVVGWMPRGAGVTDRVATLADRAG